MDTTSIGDRMKMYESAHELPLMPLIPVCARLDGKAFHSFTRGLRRPYDERLHELMVATTEALVEFSNARIGYTQSDEITLIWLQDSFNAELFMGGRVFKMQSLLAAYASSMFRDMLCIHLPEKRHEIPLFDCRVWQVPSQVEACNVLVWREQDAKRNSILAAGQAQFSHNQLFNKKCNEVQEMLFLEKSINWNDYPAWCKRGTYVQRRKIMQPFTTEELEALPPKHHARSNPDLMVERHQIRRLEMPPIARVSNRDRVVFLGEDPVEVKDNITA